MKKNRKGCLGCLGVIFVIMIVGIFSSRISPSRSSKLTAENYASYTLGDATYQVPSSWKVEEDEKQQIFYPDKDSELYVGYTSGLNILDATQRAGFVEGLNKSGTVSDETKYTVNGQEGYTYSVIVTNDNGQEFPGKLFTINAPQGAISFLYASVSDKSDDYLKIVEKIVSQVAFSKITASSQVTSSSETTASSSEEVSSSFVATDTSDATIESMITYGDYLDMYELIVNEYVSNYEGAIQQYGLGDATLYQGMRDQVTTTIEQQKAQYGSMKDAKIVGKEKLVQFLKEYRDQLKGFTDQMATGF